MELTTLTAAEMGTFLFLNIPAIICIAASIWFLQKRRDGWGWFLFVGVMLAQLPTKFLGQM